MRTIVIDTYECEICGTHYETPEQALACEAAGRPRPRYHPGDRVRLDPEQSPEALKEERFVVERALVTLFQPAWLFAEDGAPQPPVHTVSYILQNHLGQVGFIAERQVLPVVTGP
ncbi:MAG: hypothetical protein ACOY93_15735 [Bacillota bacterium]